MANHYSDPEASAYTQWLTHKANALPCIYGVAAIFNCHTFCGYAPNYSVSFLKRVNYGYVFIAIFYAKGIGLWGNR